MVSRRFYFIGGLFLLLLLLVSGASSAIAADLSSTENIALEGRQILWFHNMRLFTDSKEEMELSPVAVSKQRERIKQILDEGKTPIGAVNTWIFPEFANAPRVPGPNFYMGLSVVRHNAVPPLNSSEYIRLVKIRTGIVESLAMEFLEIDTWIIGFEGNYYIKDLNGRDLDLNSYGDFILDILANSRLAIRKANPDAVVICHFLGRVQHPISISGELIQPVQILNMIEEKIQNKNESSDVYFDQLAIDLDPTLADDRAEEILDQMESRSVGWHGKWFDSFSTATNDLTANYADWEDVRTTITLLDVTVANGDARCYLTVPDNESVEEGAGAKTVGVTVVPSSIEFNGNSSYRNYWTGVMDFRAVDKTANDSFEHAGAFIRVNDRTWATIDQTRIGTIVWTDSNTASLQFTGDNSSNSSLGSTWLEDFYISEHPFDDAIYLWRLQIHEREIYTAGVGWELEWKAEVWKDPFNAGREKELVGTTAWKDASYFEGKGIDIPELNGSGYLFGLIGSDGAVGEMDVGMTSTSYWEY